GELGSQVFQLDASVCETLQVHCRPVGDQLLRLEEILRTVNRVDGKDAAAGEVNAGKGAFARIAPYDSLVVALRKAGDLQLQVVLVGPEPGNLRVPGIFSTDIGCGSSRLLQSVLHGLEPETSADEPVGMHR